MAKALRSAKDARGRVRRFALDVQDLHKMQRGAAQSGLRASRKRWLESEAGQSWETERALLLRADDEEEEAAADSDGDAVKRAKKA